MPLKPLVIGVESTIAWLLASQTQVPFKARTLKPVITFACPSDLVVKGSLRVFYADRENSCTVEMLGKMQVGSRHLSCAGIPSTFSAFSTLPTRRQTSVDQPKHKTATCRLTH